MDGQFSDWLSFEPIGLVAKSLRSIFVQKSNFNIKFGKIDVLLVTSVLFLTKITKISARCKSIDAAI
jgi:hypothetical protein